MNLHAFSPPQREISVFVYTCSTLGCKPHGRRTSRCCMLGLVRIAGQIRRFPSTKEFVRIPFLTTCHVCSHSHLYSIISLHHLTSSRSLAIDHHERMYAIFFLFPSKCPDLFVSTVRFLNLVRPFLPILPEVSSPDRKVRNNLTASTLYG